ncbi:MAG TPA: hypothetical protein VF627_09630 [Abditibacterium sp.]
MVLESADGGGSRDRSRDHELTLIIADFGLGSDAPVALDYSQNRDEPRVTTLKWDKAGNHWVQLAPNFDRFLKMILD